MFWHNKVAPFDNGTRYVTDPTEPAKRVQVIDTLYSIYAENCYLIQLLFDGEYSGHFICMPTCIILRARSVLSLVNCAACSIAYARVIGPEGNTATASTPSE